MDKFLTVDLDTPGAKAVDWILSFVSIAVGVWYAWDVWIVMGILGCVAAWYRPLTKVQAMARELVKRKAAR